MKWFKIEKKNRYCTPGLCLHIWRWWPRWCFSLYKNFPLIWIDIFPREILEPPHLVHNFDNDYVGIGMVFPHKGRMAKVAIRLENDLTPEELKKGIITLAKSVGEPEKPGSGVIFDHGIMRGKEIKIRCKEK